LPRVEKEKKKQDDFKKFVMLLIFEMVPHTASEENNFQKTNNTVGVGIFDFCAISRRLISKDSISSPNFSCGCSYAERALWCRNSKRRALGNYFSVRIWYEFLLTKFRGD